MEPKPFKIGNEGEIRLEEPIPGIPANASIGKELGLTGPPEVEAHPPPLQVFESRQFCILPELQAPEGEGRRQIVHHENNDIDESSVAAARGSLESGGDMNLHLAYAAAALNRQGGDNTRVTPFFAPLRN